MARARITLCALALACLQAQAQNHGGIEVLDLGRCQIVRREDGRLA
jgi:hypothetical protein